MITGYHHVEINGVKYRLAEDGEGNHYNENRQPLRLQTGAVVQGESGKFQLRTDILEWRLTDWSGGEGAIKFDSDEPTLYWEGHNIDPFDEIGKLKLARGYELTVDNGLSILTKSLQLAKGAGGLWGHSVDSNGIYKWDDTNNKWGTPVTNSAPGFATGQYDSQAIVGDTRSIYLKEDGISSIWHFDGTSTFTEWNTDVGITAKQPLASLADYIYIPKTGTTAAVAVYEIPKSGTAPVASTEILSLSAGNAAGLNFLVAGTDRIFVVQRSQDESVIWRITPSTATSAGFGEEILRQKGIAIETLWFHMGVLFMAGRIGASGSSRRQVIMYLRGSEVGVLANLRDGVATTGQVCATDSQEFEKAYFLAQYGPGDGTAEWTLFAVDLISGAVAGTTVIDIGDTTAQPQTLVAHNGSQFFGTSEGGSTFERTIRVLGNGGNFVDTSSVTARLDSSIHDFGVVDEKILLSLRLACEPLGANSSIELQYQIDQSGSWTSAGTYATAGGSGTNFTISTDTSVVAFRSLQLRIILSNNGTVSESPVVLSVAARATVAAGLKVWDLLLDLADDAGEAGAEKTTGTVKAANVRTLGESDSVVDFKDGYADRRVGQFIAYDVVMDDYSINMRSPGEGTAFVRLREVT